MTATRELEAEEARAAAGIERIECGPPRHDKIEYPIPGAAFGLGADAVPEILVEMGGAPAPMRRHLLLDRINLTGSHIVSPR